MYITYVDRKVLWDSFFIINFVETSIIIIITTHTYIQQSSDLVTFHSLKEAHINIYSYY